MRIRNYEAADRLLGKRSQRALPGKETFLAEVDNPVDEGSEKTVIAVQYHDTNVLIYLQDGGIVYNHGGWVTATTASRMNDYGPEWIQVRQAGGHMFITAGEQEVPFEGTAVLVTADKKIEQLPYL